MWIAVKRDAGVYRWFGRLADDPDPEVKVADWEQVTINTLPESGTFSFLFSSFDGC